LCFNQTLRRCTGARRIKVAQLQQGGAIGAADAAAAHVHEPQQLHEIAQFALTRELHLRSSDTLCAALALADWPACVRLCLHQAVLGPQPHQDGGALAAVGNPASQQNAKYVRPGCQHDPVARHLRAGLALAWFTQRCARLHAVYLGHQLSKLRLDCLRAAHTAVCDQR